MSEPGATDEDIAEPPAPVDAAAKSPQDQFDYQAMSSQAFHLNTIDSWLLFMPMHY